MTFTENHVVGNARMGGRDDAIHLLDAVEDLAILKLDPEGRVLSWNSGARLLGYADREIVQRHFSVFYTPQDRESHKPQWQLAEALWKGCVEAEDWRVRQDGEPFWAKVRIKPLKDDHGKLIGFSKTMQDITDLQKEKEEFVETLERLSENEQKLHCLIRAVGSCALYMLDEAGMVSAWNTRAESLTGFRYEEVVGRHFTLFFTDAVPGSGGAEGWLDRAEEEGRHTIQSWFQRKDGGRFLAEVSTTPVYDKHAWLRGFAQVARALSEPSTPKGRPSP